MTSIEASFGKPLISSLSHELEILSRATHYPNLSTASRHVGLSQPQLSRILHRIEEELGVRLLDREIRRKSGWSPMALKIADAYRKTARILDLEIKNVLQDTHPSHLQIATLEGLSFHCARFAHELLNHPRIKWIELNVLDLDALEEEFLKDNLHFIFSFREPSQKKLKHSHLLGYQKLTLVQNRSHSSAIVEADESSFGILSSHEFHSGAAASFCKPKDKMIVSNSLAVRKFWLESYGGKSLVPGDLQKRKTNEASVQNEHGVYLLGADSIPASLWSAALKAAR